MNSLTRTENQALARTVLELDVNNHAGVMSHVVGLFSRRAYNVEGILVMPVGSGATPWRRAANISSTTSARGTDGADSGSRQRSASA